MGNGDLLGAKPRFVGPPYYLVNDTFTTDRAAGAVNNTNAEPGPGRRLIQDGAAKLSLSGGNAVFSAGGGPNDPQIRLGPVPREPGRLLVGQFSMTSYGLEIGFDSGVNGSPDDGVGMSSANTTVRWNLSTVVTVAANALSTIYQVAVVLRATGALHFIKGGAFTNWTLLWITAVGNDASAYALLTAVSATSVATSAYLRVPAARWLPTPLLSDGFSTFATSAPTATDGLGHAEGIAGGLGVGGGGLWPYTQVGTWQASGGVASASALSGGVALAYLDVEALDLFVTVKVVRNSGVAGLLLRGDATNHVRAVHNGTNAQLIKRVAGVDTTLIDAAATYVAGAEIRAISQGQAFRLFYNNVAIGSEQTIADAGLNTDGYAGIYTTGTDNTFDDLVGYARGSGGEYAALDAWATSENPWTGATWAMSGGNAYNTPTLGAELIVNGGFGTDTIWTKEPGWSIVGGVAAKAAGDANWIWQSAAIVGRYHQLTFDVVSVSGGEFRGGIGGVAIAPARTTTGTGYACDGFAAFGSYNGVSCSSTVTGTIDNISLRPYTTSTLIASLSGSSSNETVAAKIATLTTGRQAGVIALMDSASNPQNMLVARHNGELLILEKIVAGVHTFLIYIAVSFTANAQIEIRRPSGNTFQLWYNGTQRGTDQTVSDAGIISNTLYGLFSTHTSEFSEFSLGGVVIPFQFPGA